MNTQTPVETSNSRNILSLSLMCLLGIMARSSGLAAVNHSPQWDGTTSLTYNLIDVDGFDPKAYYYCKWGNYLDFNSIGTVDLYFNHLTLGPYNNSNSDLFVTQTPPPLARVSVPPSAVWTVPNESQLGSVTFSLANNQVELYRYLHFRNNMTDLVTGNPIDASAKKIIVVFHGWNPNSNSDSFAGSDFQLLLGNISAFLDESDWSLVVYHWEADADTGPSFPHPNVAVHATRAAEIAHQHGQHLAELLLANSPNLEKLHLMAHSAGSWAARTTMRNVAASMPDVLTQLTLLDPFMPSAVGVNSSLGEPIMSQADSIQGSVYLLENYYAEDIALGTQETFSWRPHDIPDLRVDWIDQNQNVYHAGHDGPILWYASTLYSAAPGNPVLASLAPFQLSQVGWQCSMFFQEPIIIRNPTDTNINSGASLTLSVGAINWFQVKNPQAPSSFQYQWWRNGQAVPGATGPDLSFSTVRVSDSGSYSATVSNAAGVVTSSTATLTVTPGPADLPRLSLLRPNGGPASVQFNVVPAETYRLQATANFTNWTTILTTNAVSSPVLFTDPDSLNLNQRSYRVLWP